MNAIINVFVSALLSLGNVGAFAILAVGIVMIYRASKVLNLAHGAMVMFPPYVVWVLNGGGVPHPFMHRFLACIVPAVCAGPLVSTILIRRVRRGPRLAIGSAVSLASLVSLMNLGSFLETLGLSDGDVPLPLAIIIGIAAGGALGYLVERVFVRSLRAQGPTAQTVGTVAALGIVVAVSAKVFGAGAQTAPAIFPVGKIDIANGSIRYGEIGLFLLGLIITGSLIMLFQKTDLGLVMRGTAENRRAAALMGVDPDRITGLTWVMGGALAAISGILLASITNLHPYVLSLQALNAFVAALLGGMASLPGAVLGAGIVGMTQSVFPSLGLQGVSGVEQLFLALLAIAAMITRGQRIVGGDVRSESVAAAGKQREQGIGGLARAKRPLSLLGVLFFGAFPFLVSFSILTNANRAAQFTLIAVSLVILIGWVGQISLGHAALVGIGAYSAGWITAGFHIPFPLSLPTAAAVSAGIAAMLGVVAVRVRGLFLAVATLIFSWMGSEFLFRQGWFIKHSTIESFAIGKPGAFPYFDFSDARTLYFLSWAIVAIALFCAANLRDSKTGRAFFAVQGSEMAAASLGIDVARYKLIAFSLSGALAGIAGNLIMADLLTVDPEQFAFNFSLLFVSIAVVGGLRSLGGAIAAGVVFASLNEIGLRVHALNGYIEVFSAGLLALVLLLYPTGLAGLGGQFARWLGKRELLMRGLARIDRSIDVFLADVTWAKARLTEKLRERVEVAAFVDGVGSVAVTTVRAVPSRAHAGMNGSGAREADVDLPAELPPVREDRPLVVRSENVTVRFGGLTAVNDVTMEVRKGEIVGLIGPNGAGKTVSFNSIAGLVTPTEGKVFLYGNDVTHTPVHERARLGIARTFQVLQLFPALTAFENLMVATHLQNGTGLLAHATASRTAVESEHDARARVQRIVDLLDLHDVIDKYPGDLPFGTLRLIEVARALVTGLEFLMLDEAFSGLDDTETEQLVATLVKVRDFGVTILLIEHDVKLVMSVSDYVYVLDRGRLIAEGVPAVVQRDSSVIEAYLGKEHADEGALEEATV